jgi:hypothetical protein
MVGSNNHELSVISEASQKSMAISLAQGRDRAIIAHPWSSQGHREEETAKSPVSLRLGSKRLSDSDDRTNYRGIVSILSLLSMGSNRPIRCSGSHTFDALVGNRIRGFGVSVSMQLECRWRDGKRRRIQLSS